MAPSLWMMLIALSCWGSMVSADDVCDKVNQLSYPRYGTCNFRPRCYECYSQPGCTFDLTSGNCKMASTSLDNVNYCHHADIYCKMPHTGMPDSERKGQDGCVCPRVCDNVSSLDEECVQNGGTLPYIHLYFVSIFCALILGGWLCILCIRQRETPRKVMQAQAPQETTTASVETTSDRDTKS